MGGPKNKIFVAGKVIECINMSTLLERERERETVCVRARAHTHKCLYLSHLLGLRVSDFYPTSCIL
jgi:hypothetical protein